MEIMNWVDHLSYSSISMYLDCPEAWHRKYLLGEPTKKSTALAFGSAWHGALERIVQLNNPNLPAPNQPSGWNEIWIEEFGKAFKDVSFEEGETREQHCNEGIRLLNHPSISQTILSIQAKHDDAGAMIEREVELHVPNVGLPVIGYIDIILEDGTPADFKTSAKSWTDNWASDSLQTLFYLAALNQAGFEVNWKFTHFIFVKTKTPQVQVLEHSHKPAELFFLFEIIRRVWEGMSKEIFPMNPTTWRCNDKYCDFYANCRGKYV